MAATASLAFPDWQNSAPDAWSSDDVYQILNNSPWTRSVKMSLASSSGAFNQTQGNPGNGPNGGYGNGQPAGIGGRRGGLGGSGRSSGTYSSGGSAPPASSKSGPTTVVIQWQSALPVRLAAAKKAGQAADLASLKPQDDYVVAVIGLPATALGGRAASVDTDATLDTEEEGRIVDRVKSAAALMRSGHEPLMPTKVELDQGADGRMLIHFAKTDPIAASDKNVEFKLAMGHMELRKKFPLKEMEYQGKLAL